jgi:hypothetical protein
MRDADRLLWDAAKDVLDPHSDTLLKHVPPPVRWELRDTVMADIAVEMEKMCDLLPTRLFKVLRARLKMEVPAGARDQFISRAARAACNLALAPTDKVADETRKLKELKARSDVEGTVIDTALRLGMAERDELGALVQDTAQDRHGGAFVDKFRHGTHVLLLRHLQRYSHLSEKWTNAAFDGSVHEVQTPGQRTVAIVCPPARGGAVEAAVPAAAGLTRWVELSADVRAGQTRATEPVLARTAAITFPAAPRSISLLRDASPAVVPRPPQALATGAPGLSREHAAVRLEPVGTAAPPPLQRFLQDSRVHTVRTVCSPPAQCLGSVTAGILMSTPCAELTRLAAPAPLPDGAVAPRPACVPSAVDAPVRPVMAAPADEAGACADIRRWHPSWRPKPFALAPIRTLRCAQVRFTATTELGLWRAWTSGELLDEYGDKVAPPTELDKERALEYQRRQEPGAFFDMSGFKSRRAPVWQVASYRTNGVELGVNFVSGMRDTYLSRHSEVMAFDADRRPALRGADAHRHFGHIRLGQTREDGVPAEKGAPPVRLVGLDPNAGERAVAYATTLSTEAPSDARFRVLSQTEHDLRSGNTYADEQEQRRRRPGTTYHRASKRMEASAGRRRSASASFLAYVDVSLETLGDRAPELVCTARAIVQMMRTISKQSAIDRAADEITDRVSARPEKARYRKAYAFRAGAPKLTPEERSQLVLDVRRIRSKRRSERSRPRDTAPKVPVVVFYGDARFASQFPHGKLRRQVGLRALHADTCEWGSSSRCPCSVGRGCIEKVAAKADDVDGVDLVDIDKNITASLAGPSSAPKARLRAHKGGGECFLAGALKHIDKYYSPDKNTVCFDRDDLAALNILLIGRSWYHGHGRPQAFRRREE